MAPVRNRPMASRAWLTVCAALALAAPLGAMAGDARSDGAWRVPQSRGRICG